MMTFYPGNKTGGIPGLFGDPYYWWESGAAFGVGDHMEYNQFDRLLTLEKTAVIDRLLVLYGR